MEESNQNNRTSDIVPKKTSNERIISDDVTLTVRRKGSHLGKTVSERIREMFEKQSRLISLCCVFPLSRSVFRLGRQ